MSNFVFIPGAWLGAWSWYPVAQRLREQGHRVLPLTLPGLAYGDDPSGLRLSDATDFIVHELEARSISDLTLVCHSWGGYPATGAAHLLGNRVAEVVYYNAVVPESGRSMGDENDSYGEAIAAAMSSRADQTIPLPFEVVGQGMMQDESVELQRAVYSLTLPQPGGYMVDSLSVGSVTEAGIPARYLLGATDISLARPGAEFAARLGVVPTMVEGSHMAMFTRPESIAAALASPRPQ